MATKVQTTFVAEAHIVGLEKRKTKAYAFAIEVIWSDKRHFCIYRQYGEFFQLQNTLGFLFPDYIDALPTLPSFDKLKRVLGLLGENTCNSRIPLIDNYCKTLIALPAIVSRSHFVCSFFEAIVGDILVSRGDSQQIPPMKNEGSVVSEMLPQVKIASNFKALDEEQLDVDEGDYVVVLGDAGSGWTLVGKPDHQKKEGKKGWIPSDVISTPQNVDESMIDQSADYARFKYFNPMKPEEYNAKPKLHLESYMAIASYGSIDPCQLSFETGELLEIVEKYDDGWWLGVKGGSTGWIPSTYLSRLEPGEEEVLEPSESNGAIVYDVLEDHEPEYEDEVAIPKGCKVEVLQRQLSGWWKVRYNKTTGLFPASKLQNNKGRRTDANPLYDYLPKRHHPPSRKTVIHLTKSTRHKKKGKESQSNSPISKSDDSVSDELKQWPRRVSATRMRPSSSRSVHSNTAEIVQTTGTKPPTPSTDDRLKRQSDLKNQSLSVPKAEISSEDSKPRFTKRELMAILQQRDHYKMECYNLVEEIEILKNIILRDKNCLQSDLEN